MPTPTGEEVDERDFQQESEFLQSIFENFDSSIIDAVLKQFPNLDAAYEHLQEFVDFNLEESDDDMEEQKGSAAQASNYKGMDDEEPFSPINVFRGDSVDSNS